MPLSTDLKQELLECLARSGYLLESRLVRALSEADFFVQPNVSVLDPRTNRAREIDICAEFFDFVSADDRVSVQTHFVIEAINNSLPLVLMTPHPDPRTEDMEGYLRCGTTPDPCPFLDHFDLFDHKAIFESPRYSQYCGLSRKKADDALMASHPDDLYSNLHKLAEFVDGQVEDFESRNWDERDPFWRLWFWQGVLVVGGDLLVVREDRGGQLEVSEVDEGDLIFRFHASEAPRSTLIHVVREQSFMPYIQRLVSRDHELAERLRALRTSGGGIVPDATP